MSEHQRKQTEAMTPQGVDVFMVIAERLHLLKAPVSSVLGVVEKLPARDAFAAFAMAVEFAESLYELYLQADATHWNGKAAAAMDQAATAPSPPLIYRN